MSTSRTTQPHSCLDNGGVRLQRRGFRLDEGEGLQVDQGQEDAQ